MFLFDDVIMWWNDLDDPVLEIMNQDVLLQGMVSWKPQKHFDMCNNDELYLWLFDWCQNEDAQC